MKKYWKVIVTVYGELFSLDTESLFNDMVRFVWLVLPILITIVFVVLVSNNIIAAWSLWVALGLILENITSTLWIDLVGLVVSKKASSQQAILYLVSKRLCVFVGLIFLVVFVWWGIKK